jgi:3-hydroxybutyryl-CoA dehydratase
MSVTRMDDPTTLLPVGYSFSTQLYLSEHDIIEGAISVGDLNPIHRAPDTGHPLKFGGVIASGSHVTGLFTAMIPTEFSKFGPMIGAQMSVKFLRPIFPDVRYLMEWTIESFAWKSALRGYLYSLVGRIIEIDEGRSDALLLVRADADIIYYGTVESQISR